MLVVDASSALALCMQDEVSDRAHHLLARLGDDRAIAPANWPVEVSNGLWAAERRGRIQRSEIPRVRAILNGLRVEIVPVELDLALGEALDIARTYALSVYDAAYLTVALQHEASMATVDARLRQACESTGVAVFD